MVRTSQHLVSLPPTALQRMPLLKKNPGSNLCGPEDASTSYSKTFRQCPASTLQVLVNSLLWMFVRHCSLICVSSCSISTYTSLIFFVLMAFVQRDLFWFMAGLPLTWNVKVCCSHCSPDTSAHVQVLSPWCWWVLWPQRFSSPCPFPAAAEARCAV